MQIDATFDTSFWVHIVYLDWVDLLLADYHFICTEAVARELGRNNPTSHRLQAFLAEGTIQAASPRIEQVTLYGEGERAAIKLLSYAADEYLASRASLSELSTRTGLDVPTIMEKIAQITGEDTQAVDSFLAAVETLSRLHNDPKLHAIAKNAIESGRQYQPSDE